MSDKAIFSIGARALEIGTVAASEPGRYVPRMSGSLAINVWGECAAGDTGRKAVEAAYQKGAPARFRLKAAPRRMYRFEAVVWGFDFRLLSDGRGIFSLDLMVPRCSCRRNEAAWQLMLDGWAQQARQ